MGELPDDGQAIEAPQAVREWVCGYFFWIFLPRNGAFCVHSVMIRQFITPVLIRLKPAKSSDIVTKPCKVVIRLCFSGIGLSVCKQD